MVRLFAHDGGGPEKASPNAPVPEGMNWDLYCGPSAVRPFNRRIHPGGWRQFLDFGNGQLGDWGVHWLDQVLAWTDETAPRRVYSTGGRQIKGKPVLNDKEQTTDAPDHQVAVYEFESFTCYWEHRQFADNTAEKHQIGAYFYGTKGTLHIGWRDGWTFHPPIPRRRRCTRSPSCRSRTATTSSSSGPISSIAGRRPRAGRRDRAGPPLFGAAAPGHALLEARPQRAVGRREGGDRGRRRANAMLKRPTARPGSILLRRRLQRVLDAELRPQLGTRASDEVTQAVDHEQHPQQPGDDRRQPSPFFFAAAAIVDNTTPAWRQARERSRTRSSAHDECVARGLVSRGPPSRWSRFSESRFDSVSISSRYLGSALSFPGAGG